MLQVIKWFLNPDRVGFYVAIRITRATAAPLIRLACCIVVKHVVVGRFTEGRRDRSQYNIFRHWLVAELMPGERLQDVANLVGVHYEGVSMILRLLGAKVGKRIYWPGSGIEGLVEYDLLEVGDDVVFGCGPRRGSPGANRERGQRGRPLRHSAGICQVGFGSKQQFFNFDGTFTDGVRAW
mmetsp:Transcript_37304/g.99397  ORF Transcript_37304/g.99397 Transcript_37304/m.99397 type:complete len:181 (-) Transcript_37304:176-718(-)